MSQAEDISGLVEQFWTIFKAPHDPPTKAFLNRCESHAIEANGTSYEYFQTGSGPTILLVHGVHGNLGSMVPVAEKLLEHDYEVVLFDAPAHGEAVGTTTNPVEISELIRRISGTIDDLHAIVAHSLGGLWALAAWSSDWHAKAFISISTPATLWYTVEKFAEFKQMDSDQVQEFVRQIESDLGSELWADYSPSELVKTLDIPGLIIHGTNDELVPSGHAADLHAGWRHSTVELVDGAGHYDIIGSREVREIVPTYLQEVTHRHAGTTS
jgi:pimeloyl-ACP methyl ester carboxylesterase